MRDLTIDRGRKRVFEGFNLAISPGRVVGLLGPSGCGKSTLMRAIVGVQIVVAGEVRVLGMPAGSRALRNRVGYVTQAPSVYQDLSVTENLRYFAALHGVGPDEIDNVIRQVDLGSSAHQTVDSLSGGQSARASLATALLGDPQLLVLDEPTVGLDPVLRRDLWSLFRSLAHEGKTLLVSSHVMDEASECDELVLMRDGQMVAFDTPAEIRARTGEQDLGRAFLSLIEDPS